MTYAILIQSKSGRRTAYLVLGPVLSLKRAQDLAKRHLGVVVPIIPAASTRAEVARAFPGGGS